MQLDISANLPYLFYPESTANCSSIPGFLTTYTTDAISNATCPPSGLTQEGLCLQTLCMGSALSNEALYIGPLNSCRETTGYAWSLKLIVEARCARIQGEVTQTGEHVTCAVDLCPASSVSNARQFAVFVAMHAECVGGSFGFAHWVTADSSTCSGVGDLRCRVKICGLDGGRYIF